MNSDKLRWKTIFAYGAPGVGAGYMYLLLSLYVMKFSTDVLLISPAIMGTIFGISRIWDAVSDPLAGYFSDRTTHHLGRRRLWMLISILPIALTFIMVFSPPVWLQDQWLVVWMAIGIISFYAAMTIFIVPHMSLGAELTVDYHERSRLYGLRHVAFTLGSIFAVASMQLFINAESEGAQAVREIAMQLSMLAAVVTGVLICYAVVSLREQPLLEKQMADNPYHAFRDVWRNHHARLLIAVNFIEQIGGATIGVLTLYVAAYVLKNPMLGPVIILAYMVTSTISVPLWIPLSRRVGKIKLWIASMIVTGLAFGMMMFLPLLDTDQMLWLLLAAALSAGAAAGCGGTVGPSVQSDIIDYDEYVTGERKEGAYFAAWNLVYKCATGVTIILTGYVLQFSGFVPNQEQTKQVIWAIITLYGGFPLFCYLTGALLFSRFTLGEDEYVRIRLTLDARHRDAKKEHAASP